MSCCSSTQNNSNGLKVRRGRIKCQIDLALTWDVSNIGIDVTKDMFSHTQGKKRVISGNIVSCVKNDFVVRVKKISSTNLVCHILMHRYSEPYQATLKILLNYRIAQQPFQAYAIAKLHHRVMTSPWCDIHVSFCCIIEQWLYQGCGVCLYI